MAGFWSLSNLSSLFWLYAGTISSSIVVVALLVALSSILRVGTPRGFLREHLLLGKHLAPNGLGYRVAIVKTLALVASKMPQCRYLVR